MRGRLLIALLGLTMALVALAPAQTIDVGTQLNAMLQEAQDLQGRGRTEEARQRWTRITVLGRNSPQAATALLNLAKTESDLHQAIQLAERLILEHPDSPEVTDSLAFQAQTHWLLGDHRSLILVSKAYLDADPEGEEAPEMRQRLISALMETNQPDVALEQWDELASRSRSMNLDPDMVMLRAEILLSMENWEEAVRALDDLMRRFPNRQMIPRAHLASGLCLERLNRWDEARDIYQRLARQWPQTSEARLAAERILAIQEWDEALSSLR